MIADTVVELLPTQVNSLLELVNDEGFESHRVRFDQAGPVFFFEPKVHRMWFEIVEHSSGGEIWQVRYSPGVATAESHLNVSGWSGVISEFRHWLRCVRRELTALERAESGSAVMPEWALQELPAEYERISSEIARLQGEERRLRRMTELFWGTGESLNRIVRDAFRAYGLQAELTEPGATYDVNVRVEGHRLLVEVTGIEGQINKGSKKIAQVLQVAQSEAKDGDRVCLAVNAHRERPLADRGHMEIVTPDALRLLTRLDAVVITTVDLFALWKAPGSDPAAVIAGLLTAPAGIVRII